MPEKVCKEMKTKMGVYSNIFVVLFFRKSCVG